MNGNFMKIFLNFLTKSRNFVAYRYPHLSAPLLRHKSIIKFLMSGAMAGVVDLSVLFVLHGLLNVSVVIATSAAYIASFWISFYLQKFWTFCNHNQKQLYHQLVLYFLFAFINLNLNGYLMHVLVNRYQVWYLGAQIIVSLAIGFDSFLLYKFIVFRKHHEDEQ